jgi:hypothetical protein
MHKKGDRPKPVPFLLSFLRRLTVGRGLGHNGRDLRKDRADVGSNGGHNRTGSNSNEPGHQGVLNEVLTFRILPDLQLQHEILHFYDSPLPSIGWRFLDRFLKVSSAGFD